MIRAILAAIMLVVVGVPALLAVLFAAAAVVGVFLFVLYVAWTLLLAIFGIGV